MTGLAALAAGLLACQGSAGSQADALPPASQAIPSTSLLRLPRAGGAPRLLTGPSLGELAWRARGRMPPVRLAIGFDQDQAVAYAVDTVGGLQALDLTTGLTREVIREVRGAILGPDATLWVVTTDDSVVRIRRRLPERLDAQLPGVPVALYGTGDRQLIAVEDGDTARAFLLAGAQPGPGTDLPSTLTSASPFGDLVAVAAPTGVYLWAPRGSAPMRRVRVSGTPTITRFSASGHRVYVGREDEDVAVLDRYSGNRLDDLRVPGAAARLRVAPYGGWLLAQPAEGDSLWVVNLATSEYAGTVASPWAADLPTVLGDATLLVREGRDVVARNLSEPGFPEVGRVKGGAADLYLPIPWRPESERAEPVAVRDTSRAAPAPDSAAAAEQPADITLLYLQVSRSQNPAWAQALASEIRGEGFPALVLDPREGEEAYRVVVGPYPSREAAESAGRQLGRPSFIFHP